MLLVFLQASCLPDPLEVKDIPVVKPEIVVNAQIIPDQSLLVLLTKAFGALDASDDSDPEKLLNQIAVNDALVTLSGPRGTDTLPLLENGIYRGGAIPFQEGEIYELKVESPTLGTVHATTTVQSRVKFKDIEAELVFTEFDDSLAQITYSIQDPVEPNWYMINVQEVEREDVSKNLLNPRAFTILLDDAEFNGSFYGDRFRVFPRDYAPGDTIAVSLSNLSEEYFQFVQQRLDNRLNFVEFLGEPVNYPSNVVGGRGFFNLYIPDFRIFILEEEGSIPIELFPE